MFETIEGPGEALKGLIGPLEKLYEILQAARPG